MNLYPDYRPLGVRKDWEHTSMECVTTGKWFAQRGVPADWGAPAEAVGWFADHGDGALRIMVADYPNGRRVTFRARKHDSQITFTTPAKPTLPTPATGQGDECLPGPKDKIAS